MGEFINYFNGDLRFLITLTLGADSYDRSNNVANKRKPLKIYCTGNNISTKNTNFKKKVLLFIY